VNDLEKAKILDVIKKLKADSPKRKFKQNLDVIVTLQGLNLKKPEEQVEFFAILPHGRGKPAKICALIGPELKEEATKVCDKVILQQEFSDYADKKKAKKLAVEYDYFIAQANIMGQIAGAFGKIFGPRGKMPNPKAGCVVPPKGALKPLYDKLQKTLKVSAKTQLQMQCRIGNEEETDAQLAENVESLLSQIIQHMPQHENNLKAVYMKLTMSKPVKVE
jgi:large subunit ribosomal protein L1